MHHNPAPLYHDEHNGEQRVPRVFGVVEFRKGCSVIVRDGLVIVGRELHGAGCYIGKVS